MLRREALWRRILRLADTVLAAELIDPAAGIENLLLTGIERMTGRAHFDEEVLVKRGAGIKFVTAATSDLDIVVGGMNLGFHWGRPNGAGVRKGRVGYSEVVTLASALKTSVEFIHKSCG